MLMLETAGQRITAESALDPIALAQPIRSFNTDEFTSITGTMSGVPSAPILSAFGSTYFTSWGNVGRYNNI